MTATVDKQQMFVELRAERKTFDDIVKRIKISKPTLIKWSKEFKDRIEEVSKIIEEQFVVEQKIKRTIRGQKLSEELDKAYDALEQTDYKNMSKKDLIVIIEKLENKLNAMAGLDTLTASPETYKIVVEQRTIGQEDKQKPLTQINRVREEAVNQSA